MNGIHPKCQHGVPLGVGACPNCPPTYEQHTVLREALRALDAGVAIEPKSYVHEKLKEWYGHCLTCGALSDDPHEAECEEAEKKFSLGLDDL